MGNLVLPVRYLSIFPEPDLPPREENFFHSEPDLIYAGFAANVCVLYRDYGTRAMAKRGYNVILLRDGTCAIESADTLPEERLLEAAILGIEMFVGSTTTSQALLEACSALFGKEE